MQLPERELRLYRRLLVFVGAVYLVWWLAVRMILPAAFNPLESRLAVVMTFWGAALATLVIDSARTKARVLFLAALWVLTTHYFYLSYKNAFDINWIVGAFITVSAVSLALFSRASLLAYSGLVVFLSVASVMSSASLRESVFLPGIVTVLLQANIGMQSRLSVIKNLEESNQRFRRLFSSTYEGIFIHHEGRIVQANEAAVALLGYSAPELVGRELSSLVHADDREALAKCSSAPTQLRALKKDGSELALEVRGKPFTEGDQAEQLLTAYDVSERERQAALIKKSHEALERSNIELQRFAFVASHDLQTPLRSIASFISLIHSTYAAKLDAQGIDWLNRTQQSVKQLQTLIQDLLDYSRLDTNVRPFERVEMAEVIERTKTLLDSMITDSQAQIVIGPMPTVDGERSQLVQLMLNLMNNALKYRSAAAPRIEISAQAEADGGWLFAVKDNGIGIAPKYQEQIFEIFKRLHDAKEYPGTGIGLAVCRRVVGRHGGRIWVESESGAGSTFYFTLGKESSR